MLPSIVAPLASIVIELGSGTTAPGAANMNLAEL